MGWIKCQPFNQPKNPETVYLGNKVPPFFLSSRAKADQSDRKGIGEDRTGVAAIELVSQVAKVIEDIEAHAAETKATAQELAQRAVDELTFADLKIRALESAQSAAEANLAKANARADEAEQVARAQIAGIEDRLAAAEACARNAEERAIQAQESLLRVEDAIRLQLLAKPVRGIRLAAAA